VPASFGSFDELKGGNKDAMAKVEVLAIGIAWSRARNFRLLWETVSILR